MDTVAPPSGIVKAYAEVCAWMRRWGQRESQTLMPARVRQLLAQVRRLSGDLRGESSWDADQIPVLSHADSRGVTRADSGRRSVSMQLDRGGDRTSLSLNSGFIGLCRSRGTASDRVPEPGGFGCAPHSSGDAAHSNRRGEIR